jgi:hypothetical protein
LEHVYQNQNVAMAVEKLAGKSKIVARKAVGSLDGAPLFHRIAEIHFPTMEALQDCVASDGGKQTFANSVAISFGGVPISSSPKRRHCVRGRVTTPLSLPGKCSGPYADWPQRFRRNETCQ